ncbi:MAG: aminoacyl-tRNA hydrolase [Phycisphaeraceae bacterium]|nr:aminoacyl-tRNA hydrolase [Phycisphaeraceae bacterium]
MGQPEGLEIAPGVRIASDAITFTFTSSSGPGGQNVNKRATRAILRVAVAELGLAHAAERRLRQIGSRHLIAEDAVVQIESDVHRSQERNKAECLARLRALLVEAKRIPKPRRKTAPSRGSIERRLETKRRRADVKRRRRDAGEA